MWALFGLILWSATTVAMAETLPIGVVTPLSGGYAHYGLNTQRGLEMAMEEINAKGGVKVKGKTYTFEVQVFDDEGKSDKAATGGRRLASRFQIPVIYTPASWSAFPLMGFNERMKFIIMATSQSPGFTTQGNGLVVRWVNNVDTSMPGWVELLRRRMGESGLKVARVGVMEVNTEVGKRWAEVFTREWKATGGEISAKESFDANNTDFYTQLTSLLASNPEGIMVGVTDEPTSLVIKQARELGFKGVFISSAATDGAKLMTLVKPEWLENTFLEATAWSLGGSEVDAFKKKYHAKYNEDPIFSAGLSYEGGLTLARAIEKAQSVDPADIKRAIADVIPPPDSIYNPHGMDVTTGEVVFPVYLNHIQGGKLIPIRK
jgi:branched-chain amino acid transport system substrate-binding protein